MRIAATADFHGLGYPDVPECDLLLIAGDWTPIRPDFERWLRAVPAGEVVAIAGNHDRELGAARELPWTFLHDSTCEIDGLVIHGSPWTKTFLGWAYEAPEDELAEKWALIPADVDVLVTHGPAKGYGDNVGRLERVGSETLALRLAALERLKLHVCGHIHEDAGVWRDERGVVRANVAWVGRGLRPGQPVGVFDVDGPRVTEVRGARAYPA